MTTYNPYQSQERHRRAKAPPGHDRRRLPALHRLHGWHGAAALDRCIRLKGGEHA